MTKALLGRRLPPMVSASSDIFSFFVQVIYDKPVNVSGTPRLGFNLDSANGTYVAAYAYYDAWFDVSRCYYHN